jgi:hypothetical protein
MSLTSKRSSVAVVNKLGVRGVRGVGSVRSVRSVRRVSNSIRSRMQPLLVAANGGYKSTKRRK